MNPVVGQSGACPAGLGLAGRLLAAALLCAVAASPLPAQKRAAAQNQYEKAEKLRAALQGRAQKERSERDYLNLVAAYRRVYALSPAAAETTSALLAVAELYLEMGRLYGAKYFQSAVHSYEFLLREYPTSRFRDDALFAIGLIQLEDLGDRDAARTTLEGFLKQYPRSAKADQARATLEQIRLEAEKARSEAGRRAIAEEQSREKGMPRVTNIRTWNADNSTRVVVDVERGFQYRADRISNPDRIYFDIYKARLSPALAGKTIEIQNGFLKTIRVAQNQAGIVRVVLEVDKVKDYSAFLLPDPHRMVIDIFGEPAQPSRAEAKPAAAPPAKETAAKTKAPAAARTEPGDEASAKANAAKAEKAPAAAKNNAPAKSEAVAPARGESTDAAKADPPPATPAGDSAGKAEPAKRAEGGAAPPISAAKPTRDGQLSMTRALGLKIGRIVIDPGHGGHDTGTIGPTGLMEKDLCLDVALKLGRLIEERLPGTQVVFTREDDIFVPLENRTAIANQSRADLFISIHANSSRDTRVRGVETYYLNFAASGDALEVAARENAVSQSSVNELQDLLKKIARNEKLEESRELAGEIQDNLSKRLQRVSKQARNRGVRKAPFVVLIGANMPSVLAEISFLSNPSDEALLKKSDHRLRVAEGLFRGIESYLQNLNSLTYVPRTSPSRAEAQR
jgi:N-acetylmuramoyl-L-alanine amidase